MDYTALMTWLLPLLTLAFNAGVLFMTLRTKITRIEALELINKQLDTHENYCPMTKELRHKLDSKAGALMGQDIKHINDEMKSVKEEIRKLREELHGLKNMLVKLAANIEHFHK